MQSRTMFVVKDVEASARWYAQLLDAQTPHGGKYFEMIMKDENVLLFLHHSDPQEHPAIVAPGEGSAGAGVLVYFEVDNPDAVFACAQTLGAELLDEPHINDLAHQYEFSLRDPAGMRSPSIDGRLLKSTLTLTPEDLGIEALAGPQR